MLKSNCCFNLSLLDYRGNLILTSSLILTPRYVLIYEQYYAATGGSAGASAGAADFFFRSARLTFRSASCFILSA